MCAFDDLVFRLAYRQTPYAQAEVGESPVGESCRQIVVAQRDFELDRDHKAHRGRMRQRQPTCDLGRW